ncbi:MAG: GMC family oxidoreductase [Chloroflexi bacterium]|nr:GMC family oxidoreductase [Chloroflexota bacterium]
MPSETFDFIIIGSGFGGSVSALRLAEKNYRVLVLERGKRWRDQDFPRTNWIVWKYLWLPALKCFGILEMTWLNGVLVLHGSGVGGGSLGYANVLIEPDDRLFNHPAWRDLADWKNILRPHYDTARRMLGVARNPRLWNADHTLAQIADDLGRGASFHATDVGVFFGAPGETVADPFFGGAGPARAGCIHCGGCMTGCPHNAKNTLVKNYLHLAEKRGVEIRAEAKARAIIPLADQADGARYELVYEKSTALFRKSPRRVRARNVVLAAGVIGTLELLFYCRDIARTLPNISPRLGQRVRTNSEELLGAINRDGARNFSEGVAITSIFDADDETRIEPVRYRDGSSLMLVLMGAPLIEAGSNLIARAAKMLAVIARHPLEFLNSKFFGRWARRSVILLVMQTRNNMLRVRLGRHLFTLFRRGLVSEPEKDSARAISAQLEVGHRVARLFAQKTNSIPQGTINEGLLNLPTTAHILGGAPIGRTADEGVVDLNFEVHNYPGLYVVDGSIMPANPGVNPSLTITALAEYAMARIPPHPPSPFS